MVSRIDPQELNRRLAARMSTRREQLGLSLRDIEAITGIHYSRVRRTLNASQAMLIDDFQDIARALDFSPWRLMQEVENELQAPRARGTVTPLVTRSGDSQETSSEDRVDSVPGWGEDVNVDAEEEYVYAAHVSDLDPATESEIQEQYP